MEKTIENIMDIRGKIYSLTFISFLVGTLQFVIGRIVVESASIMAIMWTGTASVAVAVFVGLVCFGLVPSRKNPTV